MSAPSLANDERHLAHKQRNELHSVLLVVALGCVMGGAGWLIWELTGLLGAFCAMVFFWILGPRIPGRVVLSMYKARPMDEVHGKQFLRVMEILADRAELPTRPRLYVIPSATLNAFVTGSPQNAFIAVTEGLLRKLDLREVAGVLAHEISHIHNNDMWVMGLADTMSRLTQFMWFAGILLALMNIPDALVGDDVVSWWAVLLLFLAPTIGSLLQLALSRAREYDADLEGGSLTGDPSCLTAALQKIENYHGHFWEDLFFPGRRIPHPSMLRSHPPTVERIKRLNELQSTMPPLTVPEDPVITLVGSGPSALFPRYHIPWPGIWY